MKRFARFLAAASAALCAGCISYHYEGESAAGPTDADELKIYTEVARVPRKYRVLGTATVSADYQQVSREQLIKKLRSEAAEHGANAILLVEQQVLPTDTAKVDIAGRRAIDNDMGSDSWRNIHTDVDGEYGNVRKTPGTTTLYSRTIRAEFLRFDE
ncbi:MAG: hypothetical protein MJ016_07505 [Victivallaceae bacterium]|nr:hypothetical protein [Victivallaceae bacterium]